MKLINTTIWKKLLNHFSEIREESILSMFSNNPNRVKLMSIEWEKFVFDFSKNRMDLRTISLLKELAISSGLEKAIENYFSGVEINETENRAVLHTALRSKSNENLMVKGRAVMEDIVYLKKRIQTFSDEIISGSYRGYTGKPIEHIVNVGIGGSDLGPSMVTEALKFYRNHLKISYISNVDGDCIHELLSEINPEKTLFIIVSKTFTTQETITNAKTIQNWFRANSDSTELDKHFVAVSSNKEKVLEFGISESNLFPMWDWVGGRFSLWGSVGLSISLSLGYERFQELLDGANSMDIHFRDTPFEGNIPVMLALISIWYNNFYKTETEAIIPYSEYLGKLVPYLQQLSMESNGKGVDTAGCDLDYQSGYIVWGDTGTNSQHAFFQLLHQGTKLIPTTFIGFKKCLHGDMNHHLKLMSNFFGQSKALVSGKDADTVVDELRFDGYGDDEIIKITPHRVFKGNKPSSTILIDELNPSTLGALIALYEHKTFVEGHIWNIFSFDQWGVELGKQMANDILSDLETKNTNRHDESTNFLIDKFLSH